MNKVDKETLYKLYVIDKKPMHIISKELGVAIGTVFNYMHKFGIKARDKEATFTFKGRKRTEAEKRRISEIHKGKVLTEETKKKISESRFKGGVGHKKQREDGYVAIYFPDHPNSNKDGYVMEHVLVVECAIGRHLKEDECVHHINRIRDDNRLSNLRIMTKSEHMSFHSKERWRNRKKGSDDLSTK